MENKIHIFFGFILLFCLSEKSFAYKPATQFYEIKTYHCNKAEQLKTTNEFLQNIYLPLLHKNGFANIGVFASIDNDTAVDKKIVVFIPLKNVQQVATIDALIYKELMQTENGYINSIYNIPAYQRIETTVLKAFPMMPQMMNPQLQGSKTERVYELRSYEGGTEKLYHQKVKMFNDGGEIKLFARLHFNAVFYAEVIAGSHMPNLMYMTSFNNKIERDEHWKTFGSDPEWKQLSSLPEYKNTVSHSDILLLHPTAYSDF